MAYSFNTEGNKTTVEGLQNFDLESILECGQCFRWDKNNHNDYTGIVDGKVARVIQKGNTLKIYNSKNNEFLDIWSRYFDLETHYGSIIEKLSAQDRIMKKAVAYAPGIRVLKQPLFETMISFIISANNSIPNIRRIISSLSSMYGEKTVYEGKDYFSFPAPDVLADAEICDLKLSKAGYRCDYIKKTAQAYMLNPFTTGQLGEMDYEESKKLLMEFAGVGAKVADCTLLFSGAHTRAFPVDVWVKRIMETLYLKEEASLKKINTFAYDKFGELGGYGQQYLFYYARSNL